jgi:hypothetical protein
MVFTFPKERSGGIKNFGGLRRVSLEPTNFDA